MIIRPVAIGDLDALKTIAAESGPGFTSLVDDRDFLVRKIERSIASFAGEIEQPGDQGYLFVLEEPETGDIMGTTGIEASVGQQRPLYHYRAGGENGRGQTLDLCTHYTGCSEICTLFLRPKYRRAWAGKLLSRVRFLFMAQHPERFSRTVIAEMRGVSNQAGDSPFWRWIQARFVDLDFATVSQMVGTGDNGFIAQRMPQHLRLDSQMDEAAYSVIGKVHPDTRPALHMLESEGFRYMGLVDPFDGGPTVEAQVDRLRSVGRSRHCRVQIARDVAPSVSLWANGGRGRTLMVANDRTTDFRATVTNAARYLPAHDLLEVPESLAKSLGLIDNTEVWFADLEASRQSEHNPALASDHPSTPVKEAFRAN